MSKTTNRFSPEVRARAVRLVLEHEGALLRYAGRAGHGSVTQTKQPPANPARFNPGPYGAPAPLIQARLYADDAVCEMADLNLPAYIKCVSS